MDTSLPMRGGQVCEGATLSTHHITSVGMWQTRKAALALPGFTIGEEATTSRLGGGHSDLRITVAGKDRR
ncbi:hypothetical protein E2C01_065575 [Portunus trituberculatus]|uniref:Uncharacterized protein n=1 Tax=Portunus trituberculatus TaxID=210409 RepID=A0A5B7HEY8_PORTR|nr:hypothetical protein [Portunus trituberculatus]